MICQAFLPSPAISNFVRAYQLRHFVFSEQDTLPYKPYAARAEQTLVFYPRGFERVEHPESSKFLRRPRSMVSGQYTERTNRHIASRDFIVILVDVWPGVMHDLVGIPYDELTNTFADAEVVLPGIRTLSSSLSGAETYHEMIKLVDEFLVTLFRQRPVQPNVINRVARHLIDHPENISVLEQARESFLSLRQFERKFKERMGISPKLFAGIARANKAFRLKYHNPKLDWLDVALACGYHDYQHLSKDFQKFAGETPTSYLREDGKSPERLFGLRDSSLYNDAFLPLNS